MERPFNFGVVERQGWDDDSLLLLAERFIIAAGLSEEFEEFLEELAQEENEEVKDKKGKK